MAYTVYDTAAVTTAIQEVLTKEQVSDLLSNLFPLDTPLQQILTQEPVQHVFCEENLDTFSAAEISRVNGVFGATASFVTTSAKPEGHVYTDDVPTYEAKIKSVIEMLWLQQRHRQGEA